MPRLKDGKKSYKKRDVIRREEYAAKKKAGLLPINPNKRPVILADTTGRILGAPIGVFKKSTAGLPIVDSKVPPARGLFDCANCDGEVEFASVTCPACETKLNWEGI